LLEVFCPKAIGGSNSITLVLYDGATQLGQPGAVAVGSAGGAAALYTAYRFTPTAATHQYIVKAFVDAGTGTFSAGNATSGALMPAFVRLSRLT
jgi:methylaspartate ammonia-lyase